MRHLTRRRPRNCSRRIAQTLYLRLGPAETARFGRFDRPSMAKPPPVSGRCFLQLSGFRLLFVGREEEPYFLTELVTPFRLSTICAAWHLKRSPSSRGSSVTSLGAIRQSRRTTIAPYRHYTRALHPCITPAHYPGGAIIARRGSRLAPYRHYTRALHSRITARSRCRLPHRRPRRAVRLPNLRVIKKATSPKPEEIAFPVFDRLTVQRGISCRPDRRVLRFDNSDKRAYPDQP